jgi:LPS-assembly lipoprotein
LDFRWRGSGPRRAAIRLFLVALSALPLAGCFTPLYGTATTGAATPDIVGKLSAVQVAPLDSASAPNGSRLARVGVSMRNDLIFDLTGGAATPAPTHRLDIRLTATTTQVIVDVNTARPDIEDYGINATYTLTEIATGKKVVTGTTFSRVSFNIPGQQQRFAGARGLRDAEDRAAQVIADNIRSRLASYFVAGT